MSAVSRSTSAKVCDQSTRPVSASKAKRRISLFISTSTKSWPCNGKGGPRKTVSGFGGCQPPGDVPLQLALGTEMIGCQPSMAPVSHANGHAAERAAAKCIPPGGEAGWTTSSRLKT